VGSLTVDGTSGAISGVSQNTGASPGECTLVLTPSFATGDSVRVATWTGTYDGCAAKYVPPNFRG
jgi:hypothetical protein